MHLETLVSAIYTLLSSADFRDYGPNGLQVEGPQTVQRLATATTASLAVCEAAVAAGADALLVHHGLFWNREWTATGMLGKRLAVLMRGRCNLLGYHLPLDANPTLGNNAVILQALEADTTEPFGLYHGQAIGRRGRLPQALTAAQLQERLATLFDHPVVHAPGGPATIRSVAAVSGGGQSLLVEAATAGIDAFITGETSEQTWHEAAEMGIHCFAGGHHATECIAIHRLGKLLAEEHGLEHINVDQPNPL